MNKESLLKQIIHFSPVGSWHGAIQKHFDRGNPKITNILNPCRKCIVKPICKQHRDCNKYQDWYFKQWFCDHDWKVNSMLMRLPTSLMYECTRCRKIK